MVDRRQEEFSKRLMATFRAEAAEQVLAFGSGIVELERATESGERARLLETVFRAAHSLKGAARAVNASAIELVCQGVESLLSSLKHGKLQPSPALFDLLHQSANSLERLLATLGADSPGEPRQQQVADLVRLLETASTGAPLVHTPMAAPSGQHASHMPPPPPPEESRSTLQTVRLDASKLETLLLQLSELVASKLDAAERAAQARELLADLVRLRGQRAAGRQRQHEPDTQLDEGLKSLEAGLQALANAARADHHTLAGRIDSLLADTKKALMMPISSLLDPLPKLVRDLARDQAKDAELVVRGADTEVDRRVLDEMRDPLIHLLRNAVDHGLEEPAARRSAMKPARGRIELTVQLLDADKLEILVCDDGRGIDVERLRSAAAEAGIADAAAAGNLTDDEVRALVFESGLSTSRMITDLSGRGLGLAIVAEKTERLGGSVRVESTPGAGTTFRILVPLTLSTFRGIHVRVRDERFVLPTAQVRQVGRVKRDTVRTVENRPAIIWEGAPVSLVRLSDALGIPSRGTAPADWIQVVIAGNGSRSIAFAVDEVIAEQEVLVKPLGKFLSRVRNVSGATVLAGGKSAPILHVPELLRSATAGATPPFDDAQGEAEPRGELRKSILVAEDSVTSRALLKNVLEAAGYAVTTANDGLDALARLDAARFDLVVSDVEMPRLDGLGLTERIRADARLAQLPVVLVTALGSREDRERGAEAGANAYIVKSSFDQDNLLDAVRRLA